MSQAKQIAIYLFSFDGITGWYCGVGTMTRHFIHSMPLVAEYLREHGFEIVFYAITPFYNSAAPWYQAEMLEQTRQICKTLSGDVLFQLNGTEGNETYVDIEQWRASSIGAANIIINYFQNHEINIVFATDTVYCGIGSFLFRQLSNFQGNKPIIVWVPHSTGLIHQTTKDEVRYDWERQPIANADTCKECFVAYFNDFMKDHLITEYHASLERLIPLTNGLPLFETLVTSNSQEVMTKYGIPSQQDIVFAHGRATRYKGFQHLVRAFAESQKDHNAILVLLITSFGTYETECSYQEITELFDALQVRGKIIHRFIPQEDLRAILCLQNVKAVVVPSTAEPFGMVPLEVRHWCDENKPILICSQVDGLEELIDQNEDGILVDVHNTAQFAQSITRAVQMPSTEREKFWFKGKKKLEQRYDLPKNITNAVLMLSSFTSSLKN